MLILAELVGVGLVREGFISFDCGCVDFDVRWIVYMVDLLLAEYVG